jgi:hypothetical protein
MMVFLVSVIDVCLISWEPVFSPLRHGSFHSISPIPPSPVLAIQQPGTETQDFHIALLTLLASYIVESKESLGTVLSD